MSRFTYVCLLCLWSSWLTLMLKPDMG
jgi:hypothetical protein